MKNIYIYLTLSLLGLRMVSSATCTGATPLDFYGTCVSACPENSQESSYKLPHPGFCVCKDTKTKHPSEDSCQDVPCKDSPSTPKNFFGRCVSSCPTDSSESTFGLPTPGYCICKLQDRKIYDGTGCVDDSCTGATSKNFLGRCYGACPSGTSETTSVTISGVPIPITVAHTDYCMCPLDQIPKSDLSGCQVACTGSQLNFYGKCVDSCPTKSSQTTAGLPHPGFCVCESGFTNQWGGEGCVADCTGAGEDKNFYGNCVSSCPAGSAETTGGMAHEGYCICDILNSKFWTGGTGCTQQGSCSFPQLNFYGTCVNSCPTDSGQITNFVPHFGYCICDLGAKKFWNGGSGCVSIEICTDEPNNLNFYGSCVASCPAGAGESTSLLPHPGYCLCDPTDNKIWNGRDGCVTANTCEAPAPKNFYGTCGAACPTDSVESTKGIPHTNWCICDVDNSKVWNGGSGCISVSTCTSGEKNFYGQCMGSCPADSSETTAGIDHTGYCVCTLPKIWNGGDGCSAVSACTGTDKNFYGSCVSSCPAGSAQSTNSIPHPGYCVCDLTSGKYWNGGSGCSDANTCSGGTSKNFYGECVAACPAGSGEKTNFLSHDGYCICDLTNNKYWNGRECDVINSCSGGTTKNFYGNCKSTCPTHSTESTNGIPHPNYCICDINNNYLWNGADACMKIKTCTAPTSKFFYGQCLATCPSDSVETTSGIAHPGYCICDLASTKIWTGGATCGDANTCTNATPLNFYTKCVGSCPTHSAQSTLGLTHTGFCVCGVGYTKTGDGNSCECGTLTPKSFYSKCLAACPTNSTESNNICTCNTKYEKSSTNLTCTLSPVPKEPRARISGEQTFKSDQRITLTGKDSLNPNNADNSGLGYKWECYMGSTKGCGSLSDGGSVEYSIPAGTLEVGVYTFKLTVTLLEDSTIGNSVTSQVTIVSPQEALLVKITGMEEENVIKTTRDTTLKIELVGQSTGSADILATCDYKWTITPALPSSTPLGRFFTIQKNTMGVGTEYALTCTVTTTGGQSTTTTTTIRAAKEITIGSIISDITEGVGLKTKFTFTAADFLPGEGDLLLYKFVAQIVGRDIQTPLNARFLDAKTITIDLPMGMKENDYKVKVIVIAQNILKMRAEKEIIVKVTGDEAGYTVDFVKERLASSGTKEEKIVSLGVMSSLSTDGAEEIVATGTIDKCGGKCSTTNGQCAASGCVCNTGFAPPYCTLSTGQQEKNKEIIRELANEVDTLLSSVDITEEETLSLLSVSTQCSEGSTMGDKTANQKMETIEKKLVDKLIAGDLTADTAGSSILKLLSNSMNGIDAEEDTNGDNKDSELSTRKDERVSNLKKVAKLLLAEVAVGSRMEPQITDTFELTGIVNTGVELFGKEIFTEKGPKVGLSDSIGGGDQVFGINYLNLLTNPHIGDVTQLFSSVLSLTLTDHATGDVVTLSDMSNPVKILFALTQGIVEEIVDNTKTKTCVYWDEIKGEYSNTGVETDELTGESANCKTTHFSEFAVVPFAAQVDEGADGKEESKASGDDDDHKTRNAIIGVCVAVVVIGIVAAMVFCYCKKKRVYIYIYIYIYI